MSPLLAEQVVGDAERSFRREAEQAFWFEHHRSVANLSWFGLSPVSQFGYLCFVCFEAGTATVIGPSWSHTKNAINFAGSVWLAFADTR